MRWTSWERADSKGTDARGVGAALRGPEGWNALEHDASRAQAAPRVPEGREEEACAPLESRWSTKGGGHSKKPPSALTTCPGPGPENMSISRPGPGPARDASPDGQKIHGHRLLRPARYAPGARTIKATAHGPSVMADGPINSAVHRVSVIAPDREMNMPSDVMKLWVS